GRSPRTTDRAAKTEVRITDLETGKDLHTLDGGTCWLSRLAYSADGSRLAAAAADGSVTVWDAAGKKLRRLQGHPAGNSEGGPLQNLVSLALSSDGAQLAWASWEGTARLWDVETGRERRAFRIGRYNPRDRWSADVSALAFSPEGRLL